MKLGQRSFLLDSGFTAGEAWALSAASGGTVEILPNNLLLQLPADIRFSVGRDACSSDSAMHGAALVDPR